MSGKLCAPPVKRMLKERGSVSVCPPGASGCTDKGRISNNTLCLGVVERVWAGGALVSVASVA